MEISNELRTEINEICADGQVESRCKNVIAVLLSFAEDFPDAYAQAQGLVEENAANVIYIERQAIEIRQLRDSNGKLANEVASYKTGTSQLIDKYAKTIKGLERKIAKLNRQLQPCATMAVAVSAPPRAFVSRCEAVLL